MRQSYGCRKMLQNEDLQPSTNAPKLYSYIYRPQISEYKYMYCMKVSLFAGQKTATTAQMLLGLDLIQIVHAKRLHVPNLTLHPVLRISLLVVSKVI